MKLLLWMLALALSATTLLAADVTGKWSGTVEFNRDGETRTTPALLILKQEAGKITGSIGPNADRQYTIKTGAIADNKLTIEVEPEDGPSKVVLNLILTGEDQITGDLKVEGNEGTMTGKLELKREK